MSKCEALNTTGQSGPSDFHLVSVTDKKKGREKQKQNSVYTDAPGRSVPSRVSGDRTVG